jgi:hypothetical protein
MRKGGESYLALACANFGPVLGRQAKEFRKFIS